MASSVLTGSTPKTEAANCISAWHTVANSGDSLVHVEYCQTASYNYQIRAAADCNIWNTNGNPCFVVLHYCNGSYCGNTIPVQGGNGWAFSGTLFSTCGDSYWGEFSLGAYPNNGGSDSQTGHWSPTYGVTC